MPTFNFSSYYLNKNLSDVDIVITVPTDSLEGGPGRQPAEQLPGHGIVLANVSCLFKAQIEQQEAKSARIILDVGHDQVAAARALVQYVYTGILPEYAQHPEKEPLLVHMLHLAHLYKVVDCAVACLDALMAMQLLQLDTVHLVYSLLPEATDLPGYKSLMEHCNSHLHQLFGNLEATVANPEMLDRLHKLPHAALLALLADDRTEAAAENTVLAAVQSWLAHQSERVELQQRRQLAGAVRIPQLEPMYLATVLPRIPWLIEVLGPHGLAMAAGASKGLFDVHTRPVLSNADVCGQITAAWMKGIRRQPDSCMLGPNEPGIHIEWVLPVDRLKQAFGAACAAAAASVTRLQANTAAAAGSRQGAAAAAGSGLQQQGWGSSGAAAVSAAAAAAVSFGASMFRKRKRSAMEDEQQPQAGGASPAEMPGILEHSNAVSMEGTGRARKHQQPRPTGRRQNTEPTPSPAAGDMAAAIAGAEAAAAAASPCDATATSEAQLAVRSGVDFQHIKAYSQEVAFAGYTWRLVVYFEARAKQQHAAAKSSRTATAAVNAAVIAGGRGKQRPDAAEGQAAAIAVEASAGNQQRLTSLFSFRRSTVAAAGSTDMAAGPAAWVKQDLGSLQTPWGSRRGPRAAALTAQKAAGGQAAGEGPVSPGQARQAVAAAAAMRLPDELPPAAEAGIGTPPSAERERQPAEAASDSCSWEWHARLAIEAWPCIALQQGVSVAAFSASLAVKRNGGMDPAAAAAAAGRAGARARQVSASIAAAGDIPKAAAGQHDKTYRHRLRTNGAGAAASGRLLAAGAGSAAARAAARAPRNSSTQLGAEAAEPAAGAVAAAGLSALQALAQRPPGEHGRRAAAVVAQQRIAQQQAGALPPDGGQRAVDQEEEVIIDDSSDGECAAGAGAGQQDSEKAWGSSNDGLTDYDSDDGEGQEDNALAEKENQGAVSGQAEPSGRCKATAAGAAAAAAAMGDGCRPAGSSGANSSWLVRRMPQGRYVKSRKCDQGYSDFFKITLQQDQWEEGAWEQYLQPGGVLQIKGTIWNVR